MPCRIQIVAALLCLTIHARADNPLEAKFGQPKPDPKELRAATTAASTQPALDPTVRAALKFLGHDQHDSGGWGNFVVHPFKHPPVARPRAANALPLITQDVYYPPNLAETAAVASAFLEAGVSPAKGQGVLPLRRALEQIEHLANDPKRDQGDTDLGITDRCAVTRTMLNPSVDDALALDALLAYRAAYPPGTVERDHIDRQCQSTLDRLRRAQQPDGAWPLDFKTDGILQLNAAKRAEYVKAGQPIHRHYLTFPVPVPELGDAYILRTLYHARRAGLTADSGVLDRAAGAIAAFHDPATGKTGGDEKARAFYRSAAALNLLYQFDRDAAGTRQQDTRHATLVHAHDEFFRKLREANTSAAALAKRNPLEPPPADPDVAIRVPISSVDVLAYFLLIESLHDSAHPDARPVVDGIIRTLVRKQSTEHGNWIDPSRDDALSFHWALHGGVDTDNPPPRAANHLLTALATRTLLLPRPPEVPK